MQRCFGWRCQAIDAEHAVPAMSPLSQQVAGGTCVAISPSFHASHPSNVIAAGGASCSALPNDRRPLVGSPSTLAIDYFMGLPWPDPSLDASSADSPRDYRNVPRMRPTALASCAAVTGSQSG